MSDMHEQEVSQEAAQDQKYNHLPKGLRREMERSDQMSKASDQLLALYRAWLKSTEYPDRTQTRVGKAVDRLIDEIYKGKTQNLEQRFTQVVEQAVVSTLPRKRLTYLKFSKALQELVELNTQWYQVAPRSKAEQDALLRKLRLLLLEIEAGQVDNIAERFHQAMQQQQSQQEVEGDHHPQEPGDSEHPSRE